MTTTETVIVLAFSITNAGRVLAYLPQAAAIARNKGRSDAVSCATWALFLVSNASSALYAAVILGDAGMASIFAVNAGCCFGLVGLLGWKRRRRPQAAGGAATRVGTLHRAAGIAQ